jgi:putative FmdB family regulatory protein
MPLYEYRCTQCGESFEIMLRFSESNRIPACPKCDSTNTQKKISNVASFGQGAASVNSAATSSCSPRGGFS